MIRKYLDMDLNLEVRIIKNMYVKNNREDKVS